MAPLFVAAVAAVKAIISMRQWSRSFFPQEQVLHFIAMATAEDVAANAEYADSVFLFCYQNLLFWIIGPPL